MYTIAVIGDITGAIPVLNIVVDFITAIALWIGGEITGVQIFGGPRVGLTIATMVVEAVPVLAMAPTWTLRVWYEKKQKEAEEGF